MPAPGLTVSVPATLRGRIPIGYYRCSTAGVTRRRRSKDRARRTFYRPVGTHLNGRVSRVHDHDGLCLRGAGIPARIYRMPAPGLTVSVPATLRGRIPIGYYRCSTARVTRCRRSKDRARRAFYRAVGANLNGRVSRIDYHDGLALRGAGIPARIYRMPAPGLTVSVPASSRGRVPIGYYRCSTAGVTRCRRSKDRARRTFYRAVATHLNGRVSRIHDHDGLCLRGAGVPARIDRMPAPGFTVRVPASSRG